MTNLLVEEGIAHSGLEPHRRARIKSRTEQYCKVLVELEQGDAGKAMMRLLSSVFAADEMLAAEEERKNTTLIRPIKVFSAETQNEISSLILTLFVGATQ